MGYLAGCAVISSRADRTAVKNSSPTPARCCSYHRNPASISAAAAGRITGVITGHACECGREPLPRGCRPALPGLGHRGAGLTPRVGQWLAATPRALQKDFPKAHPRAATAPQGSDWQYPQRPFSYYTAFRFDPRSPAPTFRWRLHRHQRRHPRLAPQLHPARLRYAPLQPRHFRAATVSERFLRQQISLVALPREALDPRDPVEMPVLAK